MTMLQLIYLTRNFILFDEDIFASLLPCQPVLDQSLDPAKHDSIQCSCNKPKLLSNNQAMDDTQDASFPAHSRADFLNHHLLLESYWKMP
jgi:hypothetical protein